MADPTPPPLRPFVYIDELSAELGIPLPTLRHWRQKGTGPESFRVGRRVAYRRDVVRRWLERQERLTAVPSRRH